MSDEYRTRANFSPGFTTPGGEPADDSLRSRLNALPMETHPQADPAVVGAYVLARGEVRSILDEHGPDEADLPAGQRERAERMLARAGKLRGQLREDWQQRMDALMSDPELLARSSERADLGAGGGSSRDDWSTRTRPAQGGDTYSRAQRNIDGANRAGMLPDDAAGRAVGLLESGDDQHRSMASQWAAATGNPAYLRAFVKWLADSQRGHMLWDREEQDAYGQVQHVRAAMGTGAGTGGEMIPLTLDPAIMLTSAGSINPLRRIARVVQTATNQWDGVTSAGVTFEWKAEHDEAADASPALSQVSIDVHLGDADVLYSYEVGMDAQNFLAELQRVLADGADQLQATAFTTGSGTGQPAGVITGATALNTGGAFGAANVVALQNALPARFSGNAQWAGNIAVINAIAGFETTNGALRFPEVGNDRLLRKPLNELSNMSGDMTTASSKFLLYGDFSQFIIADRVGTMLEILPGYGANRRPTAERHAFMTFRTGSEVAIASALRVLNKS